MTGGKNAALVWNATDTVNPDGSVQIKADLTGPDAATGSTQPLKVIVDRNASGAASTDIGPGSVNLLTGEFTLSTTDASAFGPSLARTASSRTPDKAARQEGQAPIFGKEWVAGTAAEVGVQLLPRPPDLRHRGRRHRLRGRRDPLHLEHGQDRLDRRAGRRGAHPQGRGDRDVHPDRQRGHGDRVHQARRLRHHLAGLQHPDGGRVQLHRHRGLRDRRRRRQDPARPKRIIAPTSAVTTAGCAADPATKGCRALEFVYATSTTATAGTFGDVAGQVKEVRLWSTAPGAAAATSKAVQTYVYDDANRLRQAWNPQINPPLKTEYGYDAEGRVTTLVPPGELPWTFTYGKAGNAATAGDGMLLNASRSGLKQGTTDVQEGTATTSVVYDVPLTGAAAPYGMGAADVKTWGQLDAPTDATAVFPADAIPASASGTALNASDYQRADVHYLGASGRQVNSAAPGGHIDTTEFDRRIPSEVVDGLRAAALLEGCRLVVPGAWHTDTVMGLVHTAELFEAADEAVRAEIAAWTRTGAVGEGPATEGVPAYAFGPRQYDVTSPARDFDAPRQVPGRVSARFEKNPQIALLGTADDTPEQWLKAGQAMQRVLLQATLDGLSTSLMSQPLEWPELRSDARDPSSKVGFVHMVFRLGYGPQGRATPRRPVSEVLSFD